MGCEKVLEGPRLSEPTLVSVIEKTGYIKDKRNVYIEWPRGIAPFLCGCRPHTFGSSFRKNDIRQQSQLE